MPFFICLRGECDNAALDREGCFGLLDPGGSNWLCYEVAGDLESEIDAMQRAVREMQMRLHRLGFHTDGTDLTVVGCLNRTDLAVRLSRERKKSSKAATFRVGMKVADDPASGRRTVFVQLGNESNFAIEELTLAFVAFVEPSAEFAAAARGKKVKASLGFTRVGNSRGLGEGEAAEFVFPAALIPRVIEMLNGLRPDDCYLGIMSDGHEGRISAIRFAQTIQNTASSEARPVEESARVQQFVTDSPSDSHDDGPMQDRANVGLPLYCILSADESGDKSLVTAEVHGADLLLMYPSKEHAELYIDQASHVEPAYLLEVLELATDEALQHTLNQMPPHITHAVFDAVILTPGHFRIFDVDQLRPQVISEQFNDSRMAKVTSVADHIMENWRRTNSFSYSVTCEERVKGRPIEELQSLYFNVGVGDDLTAMSFIDMLVCFDYLIWLNAARQSVKPGEENARRKFSFKTSFSAYRIRYLLSQIKIEAPT